MDSELDIFLSIILPECCALLVKLLLLIPPDRSEERERAAAIVLDEVANNVELLLNRNKTADH